MTRLFLVTLGTVLFGYAVLGRGFAYLGLPPLYAGEIALLVGTLVVVADARVRRAATLGHGPAWLSIYVLCCWGVLRTVPYLRQYGADALRDGVVWGYAGFAVLVSALVLAYPQNLARMKVAYRWFAGAYPFLILAALTTVVMDIALPTLNVTGLPVLVVKPGDVAVHLGGILLFWLVGLSGRRGPLWVSVLLACAFVAAVLSRAAMLAFATPLVVFLLVRRNVPRRVWGAVLGGVLAFLAAIIVNPRVEVRPGRWLEPRQIIVNMVSTVTAGDDRTDELQHTKVWRLAWWAEIVDYTIVGDRFWLGKGFGINLAEDDGFMSDDPRPNRYPHSVHMNFLARAGVPGLVLWLTVLAVWARLVLRHYAHSSRVGHAEWAAFFLFLFGYWSAFLVNASFDVFLEGPMGGVWFWCVMGVGLGSTQVYARTVRAQSAAVDSEAPDTVDSVGRRVGTAADQHSNS